MENNREMGMNIQAGTKRTHSKYFDFSEYGEKFVGKFVYKHPSLMDRLQIGVIKANLLRGTEGRVDVMTDNIAHMSSTLEIVLVESPEWFSLDTIDEYQILDDVYEEYIKWFESFRKRIEAKNNSENS